MSERTCIQTPQHSLPVGTSGVKAQSDPGLCDLATIPQRQQGLPFRAILTRQIIAFYKPSLISCQQLMREEVFRFYKRGKWNSESSTNLPKAIQ